MQHHLLVGEKALRSEGVDEADFRLEDQEEEEEHFTERAVTSGMARRKKAEAKVLLRKRDDESGRRRRSASSSNSNSSDSDESSRPQNRLRGINNREWYNRRSRSNSLSSSEHETDIRRRRARDRAQKNQNEAKSFDHCANQERHDKGQVLERPKETCRNSKRNSKQSDDDAGMSIDESTGQKEGGEAEPRRKEAPLRKSRQGDPSHHPRSYSSSSSSGSSSSSRSSSSSDSSSADESDQYASLPTSVSKPLFVPKSKRGTMAQITLLQEKAEEAKKRRAKEAEKTALQSRALVVEAVSASGKNGTSNHDDEGDEFDIGEAGEEFLSVPNDADLMTEDYPDLASAARDAWEVRELIRILRDIDTARTAKKEREELDRRRALTPNERLAEDRRTGRYRAPGAARRAGGQKDSTGGSYLQRFHHRGAFYMDEDTLARAGTDDVRHRAAEYSRAATGVDNIDKRTLPKVMQVKNFGLSGYSTKYKGLAKEDTTDKKQDLLPIQGVGSRSRLGKYS